MIEQKVLSIDGHRFALLAANEHLGGPAVVYLHGILGSLRFWPEILPLDVRAGTRWYSISLPGHFPAGFVSRPSFGTEPDLCDVALAKLLLAVIEQQVGTRPVSIAGWSTGAFAALSLAATYPDRFDRVMSIAGFCSGKWGGLLGLLQSMACRGPLTRFQFLSVLRMLQTSYRAFRWAYVATASDRKTFRRSRLGRAALWAMYQDFRRSDRHEICRLFQTLRRCQMLPRLHAIRAPTTVVGGVEDSVVSFAATRQLAAVIPGSRLVGLEGCGHMFFAERTDAFHRLLREWLRDDRTLMRAV